jgi:tetraprenyl-beta-curcumene synthase
MTIRSPPPHGSPLIERRLAARAGVALVLANARYWSRVAPLVRRQLTRWQRRAQTIEDPILRAMALQKLSEESFNAEVAATLATLAPRAHRGRVVEAIVALEVLYDFLDGLTESPSCEAPGDGERLFTALTDAVSLTREPGRDYYRDHSRPGDSGYLEELTGTVRRAVAGLPAAGVLAELMRASAARAAAAQLHIHGATHLGDRELTLWARSQAAGTSLQWREFLAGAASSVLVAHALIAAAADPETTHQHGLALDRMYLSIAVLPTVLDSLVDHEHDTRSGRRGYARHYEDPAALTRQLASVIDDAVRHARSAPNGPHHVMTLVGVVAYYASASTAASDVARPVTDRITGQLRPLITPTLAVMRIWRAAKRLRLSAPGSAPTSTAAGA